jgi:hypothetical protein
MAGDRPGSPADDRPFSSVVGRMALNIKNVRVLKKPLVLAHAGEIDALESKLWLTFPSGYREYVTKLGEGVLGGTFVRIYPPWRIDKELGEWRQRISRYWFWEKSRGLLPKERALECIVIGDTLNGDELIFHPTRSNRLFVLPRESEKAIVVGSDVLEAVEWMCSSGKLTKPFSERDFEPFDSRKDARHARETEITDPEGESLNQIVSLGLAWAKRRSALKIAQTDLRRQVAYYTHKDVLVAKEEKATLLYEALVLEGKYPYEPGYLAVFRVDDKASGLEVGTVHWSMTQDSRGYHYAPNHANLAKLRRGKR